jgi:hypothetical protein
LIHSKVTSRLPSHTKPNNRSDDAEFSGRSDYQAFIVNGIPAGGLFTGAEVPKTAEQQAIWGVTTGAQFDPCYHAACDTFANVALHALDVNSDAIGFAVLTYAYSTESVNGVPGRKVPGKFGFRLRPALRAPSSRRPTPEAEGAAQGGRPLPLSALAGQRRRVPSAYPRAC